MTKRKLLASVGALLASAGFSVAQVPNGYVVPQTKPAAMTATAPVAQPLPSTMVQAVPAQPEVIPPPAGATPAPAALPPAGTGPAITNPGSGVFTEASSAASGSHFWVSGEYLLWWTKNAPVPVPLLASEPVAADGGDDPLLFGNQNVDFGHFSGGRLTAGWFLDPQQTWGIEMSGFLLERQPSRFQAAPGAGTEFLAPFFNPTTGAEDSFFYPAGSNVLITSSQRLWGWEANATMSLTSGGPVGLSLLAGFRYVDLDEDLLMFRYGEFGGGTFEDSRDAFVTKNKFYGAQVGARLSYQLGRLSVGATTTVAVGSSHQDVRINGSTVTNEFGTVQAFQGGLYALPTNIGNRTRNQFAVLPQTQVKLGWDVARWLRATVGYDFLYWSSVVRPGDQIDRVVNRTQTFGGTLIGQASPAPLFKTSDFWAQGVSFGLEFRY